MKKQILLLLVLGALSHSLCSQTYILYGMTQLGGSSSQGVLFSYTPATGKDTVVHNFTGHPSDGGEPEGSLMYDSINGLIYGQTYAGGSNYYGTLFCFNPVTDRDSLLVSFTGPNGENPTYTTPVLATNGMIYGVTESGGDSSVGVLFRYNPVTGDDTIAFNFNRTTFGGSPDGALIQANNGLLYGLADLGGTYSDGVLYSFDPVTNTESVALSFNGTEGGEPESTLMQASNGIIYGGTSYEGLYSGGSIFSYNPVTHTDTTYLSLGGYAGKFFYGNLVQAYNGLLYGMSEEDGSHSDGIIFTLDPATGIFDTVFNFNGTNGKFPWGSLVQNPGDSLLYGMTYYGGTHNDGVLFSFNTVTKKDSVLVNFDVTNGENPFGSLLVVKSASVEGIKNVLNLRRVSAYPNPCSGIFSIDLSGYKGQFLIDIYNTLGGKVFSEAVTNQVYRITVDLSSHCGGVYLYRITSNTGNLVGEGKIVVQK